MNHYNVLCSNTNNNQNRNYNWKYETGNMNRSSSCNNGSCMAKSSNSLNLAKSPNSWSKMERNINYEGPSNNWGWGNMAGKNLNYNMDVKGISNNNISRNNTRDAINLGYIPHAYSSLCPQ